MQFQNLISTFNSKFNEPEYRKLGEKWFLFKFYFLLQQGWLVPVGCFTLIQMFLWIISYVFFDNSFWVIIPENIGKRTIQCRRNLLYMPRSRIEIKRSLEPLSDWVYTPSYFSRRWHQFRSARKSLSSKTIKYSKGTRNKSIDEDWQKTLTLISNQNKATLLWTQVICTITAMR